MLYTVVIEKQSYGSGKDRYEWRGIRAKNTQQLKSIIKRRFPVAIGFSVVKAGSKRYSAGKSPKYRL